MNALFPIVAAVLWASSFTLDKEVLNLKRVNWQRYVLASFTLLAIVNAVWFFSVGTDVRWSVLIGIPGILIAVLIFKNTIANALYYRALQHDDLNELNLWTMFHSIPSIIVVSFIFSDERDWAVLIPALVASAAIVWAHQNHHKLRIRRRTAPYILWSLVGAPVGAVLNKTLLQSIDPVTLSFVQHIGLAVIFVLVLHRSWKPIGTTSWGLLLMTNVLVGSASILLLYGYQTIGVVYSLLLFALQPILVNVFSVVFLGEHITRRRVVGFGIVLVCIVTAQLLHS